MHVHIEPANTPDLLFADPVPFRRSSTLPTGQQRFSPILVLPPQQPQDVGKLTVVLDIDETLIHTEPVGGLFTPVVGNTNDCFYLVMQGVKLRVQKRPFLDDFLHEASKKFELIAFTAGAEEYANALINVLDPNGTIFRHRLFRQHCLPVGNGNNFIKDLRILNRSLRRTVLVDNNIHSFYHQVDNGIPIASFFDDASDKALVGLHGFLETIMHETDVRSILSKVFKLRLSIGDETASSF